MIDTIKYGFTGTRTGLNNTQKDKINKLFEENIKQNKTIEIHHGDCVGADSEIHAICEKIINKYENMKIIIHPPSDKKLRAFCKSSLICDPKPYLKRNKDIIDGTDILIACPYSNEEQLRSGTWSTIRYAKKKNKQILLFV